MSLATLLANYFSDYTELCIDTRRVSIIKRAKSSTATNCGKTGTDKGQSNLVTKYMQATMITSKTCLHRLCRFQHYRKTPRVTSSDFVGDHFDGIHLYPPKSTASLKTPQVLYFKCQQWRRKICVRKLIFWPSCESFDRLRWLAKLLSGIVQCFGRK